MLVQGWKGGAVSEGEVIWAVLSKDSCKLQLSLKCPACFWHQVLQSRRLLPRMTQTRRQESDFECCLFMLASEPVAPFHCLQQLPSCSKKAIIASASQQCLPKMLSCSNTASSTHRDEYDQALGHEEGKACWVAGTPGLQE